MIEHEFSIGDSVFLFPLPGEERSATYLRALLENSPIATVLLDAQHRYTLCNAAFERLFQYTPEQLFSANLDELISGPETAEEAASLTRAVLAGNKVHTVAQRRRRDGMIVDVEIYGIPLLVDGELAGVYGLYQDVTERNRVLSAFREVTDQLEHLQQAERRRLARELHDSTSQELAVLNWNLSRLMSMVGDEEQALRKLVRETSDLAQICSAHIRTASFLMHPPLLGKGGLTVAVPSMVEGFEQRSGIRVQLAMCEGLGRLRDEVEIAIYRTIQEALANVLRHSGSPEAKVSLQARSAWLEVTISDFGKEVSRKSMMSSYNSGSGIGISGMRERIEHLGGCLTIQCSHEGTRVAAAIPIEAPCYA